MDPPWVWYLVRMEIQRWRRDLQELRVLLTLLANLWGPCPEPSAQTLLDNGWRVVILYEHDLMIMESYIPEEIMLVGDMY